MAKRLPSDHQPIQLPGSVRHGTTTGYQYGCKCDDCMRAKREYANAYYHQRMAKKRAEAAKKAARAEAARQRARQSAVLHEAEELEKLHGTTAGYAYGCRCARCTEAADTHDARVRAVFETAMADSKQNARGAA